MSVFPILRSSAMFLLAICKYKKLKKAEKKRSFKTFVRENNEHIHKSDVPFEDLLLLYKKKIVMTS